MKNYNFYQLYQLERFTKNILLTSEGIRLSMLSVKSIDFTVVFKGSKFSLIYHSYNSFVDFNKHVFNK